MPTGNIQNYPGGWTGVDTVGAPMEKIQVYNGTGSDLANGAVVQVIWQLDGTGLIGPTVGTPASSSGVHVLVGVVDDMTNPQDGTGLYAGIKSAQTGFVRVYGYCAVVNGTGATVAGNFLIAANGVLTATDKGDTTLADTVFGVIITGHASTAGVTDAFLFGGLRWITIA